MTAPVKIRLITNGTSLASVAKADCFSRSQIRHTAKPIHERKDTSPRDWRNILMNKAIHLSKRQYTEIVGKQAPLDRPLRFGILVEATEPTATSEQPDTTEIWNRRQVWHPVENLEPKLSRGNHRSSKILRRNPYLLLLQDICAFVAISAFVAAICILSQEIAPKTISIREELVSVYRL